MHKAAKLNWKVQWVNKPSNPLHLSKAWPWLGHKYSNARVNGSHFSFHPWQKKSILCSSSPLCVFVLCMQLCACIVCRIQKRMLDVLLDPSLDCFLEKGFFIEPGARLVYRKVHPCSCLWPLQHRVTGVHDHTQLLQWVLRMWTPVFISMQWSLLPGYLSP